MFKYIDCFDKYGRIMQFNKNKQEPIHRWYPFVEGYSKEFISSIIEELSEKPKICLEPFSGSGTTALELQQSKTLCHSFEINPFMHLLSSVKLDNSYVCEDTIEYFNKIVKYRESVECQLPNSSFKTLYEDEDLDKWNFNKSVGIAIQKLKLSINTIDEVKYRNLFTIALASILLDVSNLFRNGKCLSYKQNWKSLKLSESDVFLAFDNKLTSQIIPDIKSFKNVESSINNITYLYNEDSRVGINNQVEDDSVDLVITSPPYLNSRDYTDTYMLELRTLDLTPTPKSITDLRNKTIRSHVQVKWNDEKFEKDSMLLATMNLLQKAVSPDKMWNSSLLDMVNLYFVDMRLIFNALYSKLKKDGKVFFNVSNSAYYGVLINTLEICASIAKSEGFHIEEIRKARMLKTSPQQKEAIGSLLEGVIVMNK